MPPSPAQITTYVATALAQLTSQFSRARPDRVAVGSGLLHNTAGAQDAASYLGTVGQLPVTNAGATDTAWVALSGGATMGAGGVFAVAQVGGAVAAANVDPGEGTSSTSLVDLTTPGPAVTLTTGTTALVIFQALHESTSWNTDAHLGVAVSGATTIAASVNLVTQELDTITSRWKCLSAVRLVTGLTPGSNVFTMKYASGNAGVTINFAMRGLAAFAL